MSRLKRAPLIDAHVLATDLDGTLIPLEDCETNVHDLVTLTTELRASQVALVYVTGRHFESVQAAIEQHRLPSPDWIICDVGTTIYRREPAGEFTVLHAYADHLAKLTAEVAMPELRTRMAAFEKIREQEPEKQGRFKLSYYAPASQLGELQAAINRSLVGWDAPYSLIHSVDPFNGDGLIDLLPRGVSKAYALNWWSEHVSMPHEAIVFAGDSGNDLAAFTAGYRSIIVGNAEQSLCEQVRAAHRQAGWHDRLFVAEQQATSGVLAGCRRYGLIAASESG